MADERRPWVAPRHPLTPDDVANRGFATGFRGFDTGEVRDYLARVADTMRAMRETQRDLERRVREAEERAAHPEIDESMLMAALGEETARLLRQAHEAAADIRAKAEENAERMLKEASREIAELRGSAEGLLAERTAEADEAAAAIRAAGERDAEAMLARAGEEAAGILAQARDEAEAILTEATQRRNDLLRDLTRKRRVANIQVEQLRAGREKLLDAYAVVRRTLDEVTGALERAEVDARSAALAAGNRAARELDAAGDDFAALMASGPEPSATAPDTAAPPPPATAPEPEPEPEPEPVAVAEPEPEPAGAGAGGAGADAQPAEVASAGAEPVAVVAELEPGAEETDPRPRRRPLPSIAAPRASDAVDPERPTSSLRVIRGPRPDRPAKPAPAAAAPAPADEPSTASQPPAVSPALAVIEPTPDIEGVRVIPASDAPPAVADRAAAREETVAAAEPTGSDEPAVPVAAGPTAAPPTAPPTAPDAPAPLPPLDDDPQAAVDPGGPSVDDLFARIRAGREEAVAKAREVLADTPRPPAHETPDGAISDDARLEERAAVLEPIGVQLARRLKRALQDDQNDALDRLRSTRGQPSLESVFGPLVQQRGRYEAAARVFVAQAAQAGVEFESGTTPAPEAAVAQIATDLADSIVDPLRRRLEQRLHDALAVGDDQSTLVERVSAAYREWKTQRIERLAGDHVHKAFSAGAFANIPAAQPRRWVVDDVDGSCPDCDDNALAGPTPAGETYPTGQVHPPAHAGCRCILLAATV